MTIQELAQAAIDARASLVTALSQARDADNAAKAASEFATQVHAIALVLARGGQAISTSPGAGLI